MNAPAVWIGLPLVVAALALLIPNERLNAALGGVAALTLSAIALLIPLDSAMLIGPFSVKIASSLQILGRSLVLNPADGALLAILYGLAALWFFGSDAAGVARRLVPLGMGVLALMVASIAVEPFLFAAIFIEMAALVSIPLLTPPGQKPGRGVTRFLVYQTLAMPFILFAGWMLAGVESSPGDLALTLQAATMLGMGFAFLLAVFPLYNWMPMLADETSPYVMGFMFWCLPTITIIFGMGFLDRYAWLRTSPVMANTLQLTGVLMVVTGGVWSAFQRHLGRIMAYAAVAETGYVILALSVQPSLNAIQIIFLSLIPRGLGLAVWALSLTILARKSESLKFSSVQGLARSLPLASLGVVLAHFSTAGFPLLAGFPPRLALWEGLAGSSVLTAFWLFLGVLGLLTGAVRSMAVLTMAPEYTEWGWGETWVQRIMLGVGVLGLFILGVFPQVVRPLLEGLPLMFNRLGQ
jgi:formate hydrogenlyase subunit 3/multisubunit Na+/H+ antiporter MnhD subunit